jgi:phage gp37-like protein
MVKRKHWWNGRFGRLARVDVIVSEEGGRWIVEHRIGGVEGRVTMTQFDGEQAALAHARDLLAGADDWREL